MEREETAWPWYIKLPLLVLLAVFLLFPLTYSGRRGGKQDWWQLGSWAESRPVSMPERTVGAKPPEKQEVAPAGQGVRLDVKNIRQLPELMNGCEATSLAIVLNYWGYGANKMEIAYNYMPRVPFDFAKEGRIGPHPQDAYPGDPATLSGYYCFPPVVVQGANNYLAYQGSALHAEDISGAEEQELTAWLDKGVPLIVWRTIDMQPLYDEPLNGWLLDTTGELYAPYMNMHVVVLSGYDEEYFYFADPLNYLSYIERSSFMEIYTHAGSMAVAIHK